MKQLNRIIVWGQGGIANKLVNNLNESTKIIAYLDSYRSTDLTQDIKIYNIKDFKDIKNWDYIVIAFSNVEKGIKELRELGVEEQKIVAYTDIGCASYGNNLLQKFVDKQINHVFNGRAFEALFSIPLKKVYLCAMNKEEDIGVIEYDYVREQTLSLIGEEIVNKNILGHVAELGVYKGDFSKKINYVFPNRKLFLFDTFEGFDFRDIENDKYLQGGEILDKFNDTSETEVLKKMPFPRKCIVKKGFFPETFDEELSEEKFAFVSIDVDLYDPIYKGLEIFYPRLAKGGYIMVHDYNNFIYAGARKAVRDFCQDNGVNYVPIPDIAGTVVITK